MSIIYFFDLTPVIFGVLLIIFALADQVATILPILCGLFWILFAIYAVLNIVLLFLDNEHNVWEKLPITVIMILSLIFIGIISNDFFIQLERSYGGGGLNGIFGFILTVIFGGLSWVLALFGLSYATIGPLAETSIGKYTWQLLQSIVVLCLVYHFYI